jgi:hypothetical protein
VLTGAASGTAELVSRGRGRAALEPEHCRFAHGGVGSVLLLQVPPGGRISRCSRSGRPPGELPPLRRKGWRVGGGQRMLCPSGGRRFRGEVVDRAGGSWLTQSGPSAPDRAAAITRQHGTTGRGVTAGAGASASRGPSGDTRVTIGGR